jgi:chemotaxis protein MotD
MMNNILGQSGATDAVTPSKSALAGRKGADDGGNGFSDALSEINRDGKRGADDDQQASLSDDNLADDVATPAKAKPIIDISKHNIRKPVVSAEQDAAAIAGAADEKATKAAASEASDRQLTASEKKLKDALAAAKAITEKLDILHGQKTAASGAQKAVKTAGDVDAGDLDDLDELDIDALIAKDSDAGQLSDVLSLLSAQGAKPAVDAGHVQGKQSAQAGKRGQGGVEGTASATSRAADLDMKHVDSKVAGLGGDTAEETSTEPASGDRLFRFSNDKTRGQSMDMTVGGSNGDRRAEFKASGNGSAENITVLDSRRFIGLAPNSNSAALTSALSGDKEWSAAMQPSSQLSNAAAQSSTGSVVNTLKLQMNPHDLGSVTATLRLHGDELNVHLTVETRAAYRQLSDDSGGILDALRSQGFAVDQVTISVASTSSSDTGSGSTLQNGQGGGQPASSDERQGNAAGRGQGQSAAGREGNEATGNGNDVASGNEANSAAGGTRSGQLYL